ncbi:MULTISPECIES: hypothetical protein [unclassified Sphingomonas]|uniref:hypothetical protein n=1 Tax=unclassified Sphingomonas TaxID=196159 RepID=UPI002269EE77|nr:MULTISPECIES: hypothetical protein [unclassified Sphingomonas]
MQQATCAHSGADTGTSPGKSTNLSTFLASRRSVLTGAVAAAGVAIAPTAIASAATSTGAWDAAMRDLLQAEHDVAVTAARYRAARAAMRATAPDEGQVDWQGLEGVIDSSANLRHIDTAQVRHATLRHIEAGCWRYDPEHPQRRLAALDQVEAYRDADAENKRRHAAIYEPAVEADEAAVDRLDQCENRLIAMPAPHREALPWKIERLINDDGDDCTATWAIDYVEPMLRDARRLLNGNASPETSALIRREGANS